MDRRRAAGALLALAACIACSTAAPTASNQTALELLEGPSEGCYYNFQHYGEGDRIMTNEPCLNCTCHNKMLMCYLKVCPFTKPIGQDCTIEKRADQCCPIVTCPDVPVDLLTSTSTSSPAEYGATGVGKVDKYGCSINGKYFSEGSKVPSTPNKPCEHCYCIRNMTTCVMQECTLHVDGCTPIYHKDVCCPVRYSCDHLDDEMLLLDDMTTTVRPTPGFLLTTTTMPSVTQISQNCVHDDQIFADGALIKTEIACEHCYCMKGDIVCVVQECGTPMENEGKNCTSLPPRQGQCCPDTYICEGDELLTESTTGVTYEELTTLSPPRRVEGSGYRNEPDEPYTEIPSFEGSGEEHATTLDSLDMFTSQKQTPQIIDEVFTATEDSVKPSLITNEPDKEQNTVPDDSHESTSDSQLLGKTTHAQDATTTLQPTVVESMKETDVVESKTTISDYHSPSDFISKDDEFIMTTESALHFTKDDDFKITEMKPEIETETTEIFNIIEEVTTQQTHLESSSPDDSMVYKQEDETTTLSKLDEISEPKETTPAVPKDDSENDLDNNDKQNPSLITDKEDITSAMTSTTTKIELTETTSVNPVENEIDEDILPPGRIPGEGDCLLNGVTYKNNTNVPNINNCHSSCKCMSSIVKCDPIICSPPPEQMDNMSDCQPIYDTPDACCPTYVCHSRETIPPESHSQMSGTESPKPSTETECYGVQCDKTKPIAPEVCNSGNCESEVEDQEKECKNGACEHPETDVNTLPPPLKQPESCIGNTCQPSVEGCTDEKCQQPITSETICSSENGCQPSEACEGDNCVLGSNVTTDEHPVCKNSEECKISDASGCDGDGSKCNTSSDNTKVPIESTIPSECTEENCRRKEQAQDNKSPSECSGSSCITQGEESEPSSLTTEPTIKEPTIKLPDTDVTSSDETQKEIHFEATTEYQDTSPERSTDKPKESSVEDVNETVTEKVESSETHATKMEETFTEIYGKPETEDGQTVITDTTKPKEEVTESVQYITKETSTESPFVTQYEEHPTELTKEDTSGMPTKSLETSTETLYNEPHDHEQNKDDEANTNGIEEYTQPQESTTKSIIIQETTSKLLETQVPEQEYTKKEEISSKSPEEYSTPLEEALQHITEKQEPTNAVTQDNVYTESQPEVLTTESILEITTEKHTAVNVKDNDVSSIEIDNEVTDISGQFTTEQPVQQSSEPHEIEKDHISTENPNIFTEVIPLETTAHELHKTEEDISSSQITDIDVDTHKKTTELSIKDQEILSQPTETYDSVTDKQHTYITPDEAQEYVTSVSSIIHATQSSTTEQSLAAHTDEISMSQEGESNLPNLPESFATEAPISTIQQDLDIKEITTLQPGIDITSLQEGTSETITINEISVQTVSDTLEEHTTKDFIEVSTTSSEEIVQEDTTPKESPPVILQDNDISTNVPIDELEIVSKPISTIGLDTTVSSILSDKDHEMTTKHIEVEFGMSPSEESTILPEVFSTKSDEPNSVSAETEKMALDTSTSRREESEAITTQPLEQPYKDKSEMPDNKQTNDQTQEHSIDISTLSPVMSYTDGHVDSDDKNIPVFIDESKTTEKSLYTSSDMIKEITEMQDTILTHDQVTESIEMSTDSNEDINKVTTVLEEKEPQNIFTNGHETTTQSQDADTKLTTESQIDQEIFTTSKHDIKEEKGQTESPMSLVTASESVDSEGTRESVVDKTTQVPQANVPDEEASKTTEPHDTKPQTLYTESPQLPETITKFDSDKPSQTYPEKETIPEGSYTSLPTEYTTAKVINIDDKEKITKPPTTENTYLDISTEAVEKLIPTTEYQDVTIFTQTPIKIDSDLYPTDVVHEATTVIPTVMSSEKSFATEEQERSTKYPDMSGSETTVTYDHEPGSKPEDATEHPQINVDITTPESKTTEPLKQDYGDTQQENDILVNIQESEHTVLPELLTTQYTETFDNKEDKKTDEPKSTEQEEHTLLPEEHITTEGIIYAEQPVSPAMEIPSSMGEEQDKSTDIPQISDVTTPTYQDLTTLKEESLADVSEPHSSISDILTTESSEISPSEESNRRTLSPGLESIQPEQYTTEKQKMTELPEITKTQETEETDTTQEISSNAPEKESITLVPIDEESYHVSSTPQATEGDILLHTDIVSSSPDQKLPAVTESVVKYTSEEQSITSKPYTEHDEDTELPLVSITEKDEMSDKTTIDSDLTKIPLDTISTEAPSKHTVAQESQTEMSKSPEAEVPVSLETETEISMPTEMYSIPRVTETSLIVPEGTEGPVSGETEGSVPEITDTSMPEQTDAFVPEVTETSVPKVPEQHISEVTGTSVTESTDSKISEVTETSVTESTDSKISEVTEISEPEATELSVSEVSKTSISEATEASAAEVTVDSVVEVTEASAVEVTEASAAEVTEASAVEVTKASAPEVTEASAVEVTKASAGEVTEASATKVTEAPVSEIADISVSEVTEHAVVIGDTSVPKEEEGEIMNKETEGTTYKPEDEKSAPPMEVSPTLEPIHSSSETTPYLVELQEHTTKVDEEISAITLIEEDRTKAPETYQTDRGDQPLDNLPDTFTQGESQEEYTTKETLTKKDEELTSLPPEKASEYTEKIPVKVEGTTEEVFISSESPVPTLLDVQIEQHTTSSGEQSATMPTTVSGTPIEFTTVVSEIDISTDKKDLPIHTEKSPEYEVMHEATSSEDALIPTVTKATTLKTPEEISTNVPVVDDKFTKTEDKPSDSYSPTIAPELTKPGINEIQPTEEIAPPDFPPSGSSGYGQEPDYVEEDQAFGPGTCRYGGKVYVSAQQIPRDDPCDFCFCFRSDIICLQQSCPPPIHGCHEEPIQGFCCPRYECPVSMATTLNVTTTTTTTTTTLPPHFLPHAYKGAAQRRGCQIKGHSYKVGDVVRASSGPCLHCTCGGDGQMKCDPKACTPEPMLRQMIAAAVSAKRRR